MLVMQRKSVTYAQTSIAFHDSYDNFDIVPIFFGTKSCKIYVLISTAEQQVLSSISHTR